MGDQIIAKRRSWGGRKEGDQEESHKSYKCTGKKCTWVSFIPMVVVCLYICNLCLLSSWASNFYPPPFLPPPLFLLLLLLQITNGCSKQKRHAAHPSLLPPTDTHTHTCHDARPLSPHKITITLLLSPTPACILSCIYMHVHVSLHTSRVKKKKGTPRLRLKHTHIHKHRQHEKNARKNTNTPLSHANFNFTSFVSIVCVSGRVPSLPSSPTRTINES